jgi:AraC-like DNA-binding protein
MENIALKFEFTGAATSITFPNYIGNLGLLSRDHQRDMESHLVRACVESNKTADESLLLSSAFTEVFFVLLASYLREVNRITSNETLDYCTAVADYINRYYERKITLDDLARIAGIHPKYLCHKFSSQMGMPPMQALLQVRMEAAKKLLRNTMLPVSEVAFQVGYMDIAHFSKRFKEITGMSPKEYRKSASSVFHEYKSTYNPLNAVEDTKE